MIDTNSSSDLSGSTELRGRGENDTVFPRHNTYLDTGLMIRLRCQTYHVLFLNIFRSTSG